MSSAHEIGGVRDLPGTSDALRWLTALRRTARRKPLGTFGAIVMALLLFAGIFADVIAPFRFDEINIPERLQGPSWDHLFGTDVQGRDMFSRIIYGARTTVFTAFGAVAVSAALATTIGIISGYYGGKFDLLVQRVVEVWQSFPGLIFIIFLVAILGPGTRTLIITIGLLFVAGSSRVIRGATLSVKANPYVEAARVIGARDLRIVVWHILPNVIPIVLITASVQVGSVILLESSLSFLGYGTPPPFPSWGRLLRDAQADIYTHPYLAIFPGLAIAITVYSFNMLGDAVRDIVDPRLRGTR